MKMQELTAVIEQAQAGGAIPDLLNIGDVVIDTNHGHYILKDAVWMPFAKNDSYNTDGLNGFIKGTVVQGGDTSRLFWATSFTDYAGKVKEFSYCYLPKARTQYGDDKVYFNLQFCG